MGIARSTYYDKPAISIDDTALVETMVAISDSFEAYGYRRMQAALRHRGFVANHKKIRRLMREHDLQPVGKAGAAERFGCERDEELARARRATFAVAEGRGLERPVRACKTGRQYVDHESEAETLVAAYRQQPRPDGGFVLQRHEDVIGTSVMARAFASFAWNCGSSAVSPRNRRHSTRPCSAQTLSG